MRKSRVEQGNHKQLIEMVVTLGAVAFVIVIAVLLSSHGTRRPGGAKRVEADGVTYIACGGVIWVPNNLQTPKDNEPQSFNVKFRDEQGADRQLHRVRMLRITDLPLDTPECMNSR
jgi:hypothetical protein